jgi:predicted exporter
MPEMRNRRLALGVWLFAVLMCAAIVGLTRFRTDMAAFLPRAASPAQRVLTEQATNGAASHIILVGIGGAAPPVLVALSKQMALTLRGAPAFADVANGDDASFSGVRDLVWNNRYLLSPGVTADRFTEAGLHAALTGDLALLGSDLGPFIQQSLPEDPTDEMRMLLPRLTASGSPRESDGVWVSPDSDEALLLLHARAAGFDIDAQQQNMVLIGAAFDRARAGVPGAQAARLVVSGPGVFAVRIRDTTKRDVTRLSLTASLGAVGLLAFAYRSPLVMLLGLLPVASGALAGIAVVSLVFGFVHGVTLGFGVTLIGESLDYAIYLFSQTRRGDTAHDTLGRIWPTLRLGMLTSVAGFCTMLFSNFVGFAQLGLFSIVGLLAAAFVTRFVLPHLVPQDFFAAGVDGLARPILLIINHQARLRVLVIAASTAAVIALAAHRGGFWEPSLADLSPIPAADQAADRSLRTDLGVPDLRFFAVFEADNEQVALQESEALAEPLSAMTSHGTLGGFDLPSAILPSLRTQAERRNALPNAEALRTRLTAASAGLPFRPNLFAPFLRDAEAAKLAPPLTRANLPPGLLLRLGSMLVAGSNGWEVVAPLYGVTDSRAVSGAIAAAHVPNIDVVDLNLESDRLLRIFQNESVMLALMGGVVILLLLLLGLRSPARVIVVAAPLAAAVLVTAALLTLGGGMISIFVVVGFLLIVAVGSNYCLFFERHENDPVGRRRAVASIVLANLCTVSAYGLMSLSAIPVLHDIGKTVATGTFLSLLFAAALSARRGDADAAL